MADIVVAEQRKIIKFYVKLGRSISEIKENLQNVYRETAAVKFRIHKCTGIILFSGLGVFPANLVSAQNLCTETQWTNVQFVKSEATVTVRSKSVSCYTTQIQTPL